MNFIKSYFNNKFFKDKAPAAFKNTYKNIEKSHTFEKYCESVHKRKLKMLNTMSGEQMDLLEKKVEQSNAKSILDIGSGNGELISYLSNKYEKRSTAIDFSYKPSNQNRVKFIQGDHETFNLDKKFDLIISIDSFYMIRNYKKFLSNLINHLNDNSSIIVFKTFTDQSFEKSELFKAIKKLGLSYDFHDFTEEDLSFWKSSDKSLEELNQEFVDEDMFKLWNIKNKETQKNLALHSQGKTQRIFIEIKKS